MLVHRRLSKVTGINDAVYAAAAPYVAFTLPDGPGYYVVRRLSTSRDTGAAAATWRPAIWETDPSVAGTIIPHILVYRLAAALAIAAGGFYFPALPGGANTTEPAEVGRYGYSADGIWYFDFGANVDGDTFSAAVLVERVR